MLEIFGEQELRNKVTAACRSAIDVGANVSVIIVGGAPAPRGSRPPPSGAVRFARLGHAVVVNYSKSEADALESYGMNLGIAFQLVDDALDYAGRIAGAFSDRILMDRASRLRGASSPTGAVVLVSRAWFNENLESRNFYVPGIIAMLVMLVVAVLSYSTVESAFLRLKDRRRSNS